MNVTPPTDGVSLTRVHSSLFEEIRDLTRNKQPLNYKAFVNKALPAIAELRDEYEAMTPTLCSHAKDHIYAGELVATLGCSHSTINFFLKAAEYKRYTLVILEGAPRNHGAVKMAEILSGAGVMVRVLPDSSCFAVMSRVSKVFIGAESVLANGGLLASIGTHPLCLVAKHHAVPVVVITTTLKMCPYYPSDALCTALVKISKSEAKMMPWSTFADPVDVLPQDELHDVDAAVHPRLHIHNAEMEYVPPAMISLFVTNDGEFTASYVNRLVRQNYNPEDAAF